MRSIAPDVDINVETSKKSKKGANEPRILIEDDGAKCLMLHYPPSSSLSREEIRKIAPYTVTPRFYDILVSDDSSAMGHMGFADVALDVVCFLKINLTSVRGP